MGRPIGSKNGVRSTITKYIGVPLDVLKSVEQFMDDTETRTFSEAVIKLVKYGIAYYYYTKNSPD